MSQRIAFFFPSMVDGGAERVTLNLINHLAEHYSYQLDLVLVEATGAFLEQVSGQVRVINLNASRTLFSVRGLVKYINDEKPHAILSGMDYVNVISLISVKIARHPVRTVACLHINMSAQLANPSVFRGRFITPFVRLTHPWADVIVATSKGCGEDFLKVTGVGHDNMEFIYNPTITDAILPRAREQIEHKWFSDGDDTPVILAVGRLAHQKNFALLIDAFAIVSATSNARLLILGDGADRADLEKKVVDLGLSESVDMPGFVDNPYAYMAACEVFALSSRYEALPAVLIEAMYCGAKCVAADCPSGPREILDNGKYGWLVPVGDKEALASGLVSALADTQYQPNPKSWEPFVDHNVVGQYLSALLGTESS
ncbi:hypothetical protein AB833_25935 [Chromatiales bacterium (ex Bugula neritina AB1)]|nr:hypothetical protein AB833_25935 [Chromatiales bacterium (ex Bugula neritina AB1)]